MEGTENFSVPSIGLEESLKLLKNIQRFLPPGEEVS
jgi:hypothetical protein